jgi:hypothetical protein
MFTSPASRNRLLQPPLFIPKAWKLERVAGNHDSSWNDAETVAEIRLRERKEAMGTSSKMGVRAAQDA